MTTGLIGSSGFVGGNLLRQTVFDSHYRSADIDSIRGQSFSSLVCAGVYAAKWKANQDPAADRAAIERLMAPLREVAADRFVLLSTVDVYESPIGVDESAPADARHAYGQHRALLEEFVRGRFPKSTIVRLPGLFGSGLKKNVIYDLLHDNQVEKINPEGVFQYYDLGHLWADVQRAQQQGIAVLNVATEPVATRELAQRCFGRLLAPGAGGTAPRYDVRSLHAAAWGGQGGYLYDRETVLRELSEFVSRSVR